MFDDAKSPAQQGSETEADQREQRLRKAASRFARLAIATTGALHKDYHRSDKSLGALANELLVAFAVLACDPDDEAGSISEIGRDVGADRRASLNQKLTILAAVSNREEC